MSELMETEMIIIIWPQKYLSRLYLNKVSNHSFEKILHNCGRWIITTTPPINNITPSADGLVKVDCNIARTAYSTAIGESLQSLLPWYDNEDFDYIVWLADFCEILKERIALCIMWIVYLISLYEVCISWTMWIEDR
ncbi:hypothetical protein SK128_010894 [Halocaridina rubra]|uniref:Uncharacterized protein n=1 Tax=Halocaridina rubra TaxID=373956 RepID=A0AAN9AD28_HALRR